MMQKRADGTCRRPHGFTLVELLVVVAIIALLIGILLPVLNRSKEIARRVICMSSLKQMGTGCMAYATENEGWTPDWPGRANTPGGTWDGQRNLQHSQTDPKGPVCVGKLMVGEYIPEKSGIVYCPSRDQTMRYGSEAKTYGWGNWKKAPSYPAVEYAYQHRMQRKIGESVVDDVFGADLGIWDYSSNGFYMSFGAPVAHKDGYYNVSYFDQSVQYWYDEFGELDNPDPQVNKYYFNSPGRVLNYIEDHD